MKLTLEEITKDNGLIADGDWIETRDQDPAGNIRLIQLADIGDRQFLNKSKKFINEATASRLNCTFLQEGDILIARMPDPLGRACVFPKLNTPAITAVDICIVRPNKTLVDRDWLVFCLNSPRIRKGIQFHAQGATRARVPTGKLKQIDLVLPKLSDQRQIAAQLKAQLAEVDRARQAAQAQLREAVNLADAIIFESIRNGKTASTSLGGVLQEISNGVGESWADYQVLGATRDGLAPAKEPPGKKPQRYKPVFSGTVFYNPMRILIGSIAMVDDDDTPGITSPDYVALKGRSGLVDSRWFYYWLRSPLGKQCILSLARGAVRERMLFNRLAEGKIDLPSFKTQQKASMALAAIKPMRQAIEFQLREIDLLPQKILAQAFEIQS